MTQLRTLPEEWKMAGDSERRCVLSIIERGMVLFNQSNTGLRVFMLLLYMMLSYGHRIRGRDFDYTHQEELPLESISNHMWIYFFQFGEDIRLIENICVSVQLDWPAGFLHARVG
jgi:hypothetical protein